MILLPLSRLLVSLLSMLLLTFPTAFSLIMDGVEGSLARCFAGVNLEGLSAMCYEERSAILFVHGFTL